MQGESFKIQAYEKIRIFGSEISGRFYKDSLLISVNVPEMQRFA